MVGQHVDLTDNDLRLVLDPRPLPLDGGPLDGGHDHACESMLRHPVLYCPPELLQQQQQHQVQQQQHAQQQHSQRQHQQQPHDPTTTTTTVTSSSALVWSMGVVLHCMLTGSFPYIQGSTWAAATRACAAGQGSNAAARMLAWDLLHAPLQGAGAPCSWRGLSSQAVSLLEQLLHRDPARRVELSRLFDNPWMLQRGPLGALAFNDSLVAMGRRSAGGDGRVLSFSG